MALRAGDTGINRRLFRKLKKLAPINTVGNGLNLTSGTLTGLIKSIGTGLSLSEAGELSCTATPSPGSTTLEVKTHEYTGDGTGMCVISNIEDLDKLVMVLHIETKDSFGTMVNPFIPGTYEVPKGYCGFTGATYATASDIVGGAFVSSGTLNLTSNDSTTHPERICNESNVDYVVTYLIDNSIIPPTTKKSTKKK